MLDWWNNESQYTLPDGKNKEISSSQVITALGKNNGETCNDTERYIRDCFDWFFYRLDQIEHYVRRGFVDFEDVEAAFEAYVPIIKYQVAFEGFLKFHGYMLAKDFFNRFA